MTSFLFRIAQVYGILYFFLIPFSYPLIADHPLIPFYSEAISIFYTQYPITDFSSDSLGYFILITGNLCISAIYAILRAKWKRPKFISHHFVYSMLIFILIFHLFLYGFSKIFLTQFPIPEGNLLHTPLGDLHKETVYWSLVGSSSLYQQVTGWIEILLGLGIFFSRTRFFCLLICLYTLMHIFLVNIGFDIGVKGHSISLIIICISLLRPYTSHIKNLFLPLSESSNPKTIYKIIKTILIIALISICSFPYFSSRSNCFADLYGSYKNKNPHDTMAAYLHVHSDNFLILENNNHAMNGYKILNISNSSFAIQNNSDLIPIFHYKLKKTDLDIFTNKMHLQFKKINLDQFPFLEKKRDWIISDTTQ